MAPTAGLPDDGRVTTMEPSEPRIPYFVRNLAAFSEQREGDLPEMMKAAKAVMLFQSVALAKTEYPWATTFANELAAGACMARAARHLDAAMVLTSYGFHSEVRALLRGIYEAVGLGRTFAKDLRNHGELAQKWLKDGAYWADKVVRKWIGESGFLPETEVTKYRSTYWRLSAYSHPTRISCTSLFTEQADGLTLDVEPEFDRDATRATYLEIAWMAVFACQAFRKAVATEDKIEPSWHTALDELMQQLIRELPPELALDTQAEQARYDAVAGKLQPMENLDAAVRGDPV
jgi:hypothetical protein